MILGFISFIEEQLHLNYGSFTSPLKLAVVFGLGIAANDLFPSKKKLHAKVFVYITGTIVGAAVLYCGFNDYWIGNQIARISGVFASGALISILIQIPLIEKLLSAVCHYSFPVYLLHTIFTAGVRILLIKVGCMSYFVHLVFGIIVGFIGPICVAKICDRIGWMSFLFYPS